MPGGKEGYGTLRLAVVGLYSLLLVSLVQTVLVLYLYAIRNVDTTMSVNLILSFVSSQLSLLFLFLHSLLARRQRQALVPERPRSQLKSICRFLPRILIMLWMVAAAAGLIVAARQPRCMPGLAMQNFWQIGRTCELHRAVVAMTVVAFFLICSIFCCIEVSNRPYHASLFGIEEPDHDDLAELTSSISGSSWSSISSSDTLRREKLYHYRPTDLESVASDRALWLQRRNSHSSQSAIYPPSLRSSPSGPLFPPDMLQLSKAPSSFTPRFRYYPSCRSVSPSLTSTSSPTVLVNGGGFLPPTRSDSSVSSVSRSISSTSSRRSPLSTMRRASEPEVPIIPAKFLDATNKPQLQRSPTLPCSWSPSLTYTPLSADPAIRAFSTECEISPERPVNCRASARQSSLTGIRIVEPSIDLSLRAQGPSICAELPVRARGHSIPCNVTTADPSSLNATHRAATYFTQPRVSAAPTSQTLSSLHVSRAHPTLMPKPDHGNSIRRPQLTHCSSSAYSNRTISSTLSTEFATHNMIEAQRVKRHWELARNKDASAYGMGSWSPIPEEGPGRKLSARKARDHVIQKKGACTAL